MYMELMQSPVGYGSYFIAQKIEINLFGGA